MSASISTHAIPGGSWLVVQGNREEVFLALGEEARETIRDVLTSLTDLDEVRKRIAASSVLAQRYAGVVEKSRLCYPQIWSEFEHLSAGAGVPFEDLLMLNLRGDVGIDDRAGCSDMAWTDPSSALLAHNEDGDPDWLGRCHLVTLLIEHEPAMTGWWYPGCLPGDYGFNEHGLCWGIDNVRVNTPTVAPGRRFVSRSLQSAADLGGFVSALQKSPSAGGWAYTVGSMRSQQALVAEAAAGSVSVRHLDPRSDECVWHTNHLLMLDSVLDTRSDESFARAERFTGLSVPRRPDREWMFRLFSEDPVISGIRPDEANLVATLSTVLYDLSASEIVLKIGNGRPFVVPANQPVATPPEYKLLQP